MPPVTKAGSQQFRKDVEFTDVSKDSDEYELEASGIVMVPDKADLQNDFAREPTIRSFASQFETFEQADQAQGGIMHAVWPDGWMELARNEVLDEPEEISGREVDAGAWVQRWGITNADLAALIDEDILSGYSIGAIQVDWDGPYDPSEVDDVDTSELPDGEMIWELIDGIIREVSAVDIPAVPDAQILDAKGVDKRLADHVGNQDAFIEEALERGHSEAEAERLWDVLTEAMEADGSAEPGKQSRLQQAAKSFLSTLTGSDDDDTNTQSEAPDAAKEGRTLSQSNRESAMAAVDANLDILQDAGVDHGMTRFTDQDDVDFDLSEHDARSWGGGHDDDDADSNPFTVDNGQDAPEGDTSDDTTDMNDDTPDDPMADAPEWAKALNDRIDSLETDKDADGDASPDDPLDDAPEWAKGLADRVDEIEEKALDDGAEDEKPEWAKELEARIDTIAEQGGVSTQLDAASDTDTDTDSEDKLKDLGEALA
ncbi:XkdF-like putative serine protease domain-containing protein [Halorussus halobius]|uniref:XkdF-like putative serine protease domain-containing protein n=1 Tax=Halorussus halobius TaxID=1710537 RepID=UPI001092BB50|nr:XkdF-like putative serine protease domain-containing protein [Halorussus halobius]